MSDTRTEAAQSVVYAKWQLGIDRPLYDYNGQINPEVVHAARCLLGVVGGGEFAGYPGEFMQLMSKLALKCDEFNIRRLAWVWPEVAVVAWLYHNINEKVVMSIARGELGGLMKQEKPA